MSWANKKYIEMLFEVAETRKEKLFLLEMYDGLLRNCPVSVDTVRNKDMFKHEED